VRRQITRLDRLVEDLVDATRIQAGHLDLQLAEHDLRPIAREAYELFRGTSPLHTLVFEGGATPLVVRCDALRIEQALNNLVSNAIKYSPEGGEVRVEVRCERDGAVIAVADRGIGIAPEELDRVWEPYQRGPAASGIAPGVGLGLAVTKRIIEAHGGGISVVSARGVGSTFSIHLPLATVQPWTAARTTA
jgi:signal transduction histidine kinase